jgi:hypothetical protein
MLERDLLAAITAGLFRYLLPSWLEHSMINQTLARCRHEFAANVSFGRRVTFAFKHGHRAIHSRKHPTNAVTPVFPDNLACGLPDSSRRVLNRLGIELRHHNRSNIADRGNPSTRLRLVDQHSASFLPY